ncbi:MAG TPA: terminase small subunit [Stellaceae bacterium]|nr:terminase small subunit [Stellaceae bacterium]
MTPRQHRFVLEYLLDANATQAARRAGYRTRASHGIVNALLHDPTVRAALGQAMAARARRTGITAERVLDELVRVAFAEIAAVIEWGADGPRLKDCAALSDDDRAAIAEIATDENGRAVAARLHDKGAALAVLARRLGLCDRGAASGRDAAAPRSARARVLVDARLVALRPPV